MMLKPYKALKLIQCTTYKIGLTNISLTCRVWVLGFCEHTD